jgi:hypothetical protein
MNTLSSYIEVDWLLAAMKPSMVGGDEPEWTDSEQTVTVRGQGAGCLVFSASSLVI